MVGPSRQMCQKVLTTPSSQKVQTASTRRRPRPNRRTTALGRSGAICRCRESNRIGRVRRHRDTAPHFTSIAPRATARRMPRAAPSRGGVRALPRTPPREEDADLEPQDGVVVVREGVGRLEPAAHRFEVASGEEPPEVPQPCHRGDERPGVALAREAPQRAEVVGAEHGRHEGSKGTAPLSAAGDRASGRPGEPSLPGRHPRGGGLRTAGPRARTRGSG